MPDDTPATLANRVQKVEHVLYPNALEAALRSRTDRARIQLIDTEPEVPMLINTPLNPIKKGRHGISVTA